MGGETDFVKGGVEVVMAAVVGVVDNDMGISDVAADGVGVGCSG